jgi:hypothetical protein
MCENARIRVKTTHPVISLIDSAEMVKKPRSVLSSLRSCITLIDTGRALIVIMLLIKSINNIFLEDQE